MTFLAFLIYIPLQILWIAPSLIAVIWVGYKQIIVSKKLGVSQTMVEIINGRWTMDWFGLRDDPGARALTPVIPNSSTAGLKLTLFPLYILSQICGRPMLYPRIPEQGSEKISDLVMARTVHFDRMIDKHLGDAKQFVILGAGLDTRAWGTLAGQNIKIFELDQDPTQSFKRQQLSRAGLASDHVRFVRVDFAKGGWVNDLIAAGYDPAQETIFLWEGVTLYLSEQDISDTIAAVKANASENSVLLADIYADEFLRFASKSAMSKTLEATDEGLTFSLDFAKDHHDRLDRYVTGQGCRLRETGFLGANSKKGPFAVVAEIALN